MPGRNLLFLTLAAAVAYRRDLRHIVCGVCETDYSGYPDCRDDTVKAMQVALNLGMERRFVLHTPLMWIDKAATWRMARPPWRCPPGAADRALHPHLLPRRPYPFARLGLRLRRLPRLRVAGERLGGLPRGAMMHRLAELRLPLGHDEPALRAAIVHRLGIPDAALLCFSVARRGVDARAARRVVLVYTLDVELREPEATASPASRPRPTPATARSAAHPRASRRGRW